MSTIAIATMIESLVVGGLPLRFTAYDGSAAGPKDSTIHVHLATPRGLHYLVTAPGDLGMARAYVMGDLELVGVHSGNPYVLLNALKDNLEFRKPTAREAAELLRGLGPAVLKPQPLPSQERPPTWRRALAGVRHTLGRDAEAISHHYDVSNTFYELVLGPSMAYTCAVYPDERATLEEAQTEKFDLICRKLDLQPGQRLLDVGCGWGGMVRHAVKEYGVTAVGATLSRGQASWGQEMLKGEGIDDRAEIRHLDYRNVAESGFDAVSSIGLTEHIGVKNYPAYFEFLRSRVKPQGRLLNHCITRHHNEELHTGAFIDRYIFPDGELTGSGTIVSAAENAGWEVQHHENFRTHYARTLQAWSQNLEANWDECVREAGEGTARIWGLYLAGSRIGFERNEIQLHHVLATANGRFESSGYPLRHTFGV